MSVQAQVLVGGSALRSSQLDDPSASDSRLWLRYSNHFSFKEGMSIDSDFGHQFFTDTEKKRLSVRSIFLYDLTHNLQLGGGMGFFWYYDTPVLSQELRFMQQLSHSYNFGLGKLTQRVLLEEQITQNLVIEDQYRTRVRYQVGLEMPSNGAMYFRITEEIFATLSDLGESPYSRIHRNRFSAHVGYNTFQRVKIEATIMMEDRISPLREAKGKSWVFLLGVHQTI